MPLPRHGFGLRRADDTAARSTVIALATEIGFEGMDAGHLDASRNIENLGLLVFQLVHPGESLPPIAPQTPRRPAWAV